MKHSILMSALVALAVAGCKQPAEVELLPADDFAIEAVTDVNSTLERPSVDSTALLPREQDAYAGQIIVSSVKTKSLRGMASVTFSRVAFENRDSVIRSNDGVRRGFVSLRLGGVRLNGEPMVERQRRIIIGSINAAAGYDYVADLGTAPAPLRRFTWQITAPLTVGTFEASIESPDNMEVISPEGGTTVSRNEDLELKWTGRGDVFIIVSAVSASDPNKPVTTPIFSGFVKKDGGKVRVSKKILRALPSADSYMFTFVRRSREEKTVGRFNGRVLIQASSIYNSIVVLR